MKVIYIAGPFRGATHFKVHQNVFNAEMAMNDIINVSLALEKPVAVICPHSMSKSFDGTFTDDYWLAAAMELLKRSDAVFVVSGYQHSEGTKKEIEAAIAMGKPIFYEDDFVMGKPVFYEGDVEVAKPYRKGGYLFGWLES